LNRYVATRFAIHYLHKRSGYAFIIYCTAQRAMRYAVAANNLAYILLFNALSFPTCALSGTLLEQGIPIGLTL